MLQAAVLASVDTARYLEEVRRFAMLKPGCLMSIGEIVRTSTFRWAAVASGAFALFVLVLFGIIYWKADRYLITLSDDVIGLQLDVVSALPPERKVDSIHDQLAEDPRGVQFAGLFRHDGSRIAGNLSRLPSTLKLDATVQNAELTRYGARENGAQSVRAIGRVLPNGDVLVIGRNVDEAKQLSKVVIQALLLGLIPALLVCLATGMLLSKRSESRIAAVNERVQRIVAGNLRERLPHRNSNDPISKLAVIVNGMLDEMENIIQALAGVGNDIAHDLRTPLTRTRLMLERGRYKAETLEQLKSIADKAIGGIDHTLAITTALLRLAEIENSRRSAAFGKVALADILREIGDLYDPIAADNGVFLHINFEHAPTVDGDRDLLMEAIVNLVDNALKFTPRGGRVEVSLLRGSGEDIVRVRDSGPGITVQERNAVLRRFYRSDKIQGVRGLGLGLNLVAAIVKLHEFRLTIFPGPGCVIDIASPDRRADQNVTGLAHNDPDDLSIQRTAAE
jgi:signal transduction histidine kinase